MPPSQSPSHCSCHFKLLHLLLCHRATLTESLIVFPPRAGVGRRAPVDPSEPGGELEVRAHQHRPENRLQVQRRGHDDADGPQQCPIPGPSGRRGLQAPGRPAPCSVVQSRAPLHTRNVHNLHLDVFRLFLSVSLQPY